MFSVLPSDITNRKKYLLGKALTLQGICIFIHHSKNDLTLLDEIMFKAIEETEWRNDDIWLEYGGAWNANKGDIT